MAGDDATSTIHRPIAPAPLPVVLRPGIAARPAQLRLDHGSCIVGSGSRAAIVIDSPTVSRAHAELTLVPEGVHVKDLGSRNGTFYMGQRIESATLSPGARILLGDAPLSIELAPDGMRVTSPRATSFRGMIGSSPGMMALFAMIGRLDGALVPCLVHGESGVGKELVVRAIHEGSRVAEGPFVPVNCGSFARELVASALFGHRRGAFTGAVDARRGAFMSADGGTLFLDEIGELPLDVQPSLLRALETGEVTAVGEDKPRKAHVRIIAATHRDLAALVREGKFRQDLYYRLAVVTLEIPALRDRREDIPPLARLFAREEGVADLDDDVCEELSRRPWPGNVRELRNAILAYVALGTLGSAPASDAAPVATTQPRYDVPYLAQRDALVEQFTRAYVRGLLERTGGNQSEAARIAGLDRTYFGRLLAKLGR